MPPEFRMLIGEAPPRCKGKTIVLVSRRHRSKWWKVVCFGQKSHYRSDGSCAHTDEVLARWNSAVCPVERVKVKDGREVKDAADLARPHAALDDDESMR